MALVSVNVLFFEPLQDCAGMAASFEILAQSVVPSIWSAVSTQPNSMLERWTRFLACSTFGLFPIAFSKVLKAKSQPFVGLGWIRDSPWFTLFSSQILQASLDPWWIKGADHFPGSGLCIGRSDFLSGLWMQPSQGDPHHQRALADAVTWVKCKGCVPDRRCLRCLRTVLLEKLCTKMT